MVVSYKTTLYPSDMNKSSPLKHIIQKNNLAMRIVGWSRGGNMEVTNWIKNHDLVNNHRKEERGGEGMEARVWLDHGRCCGELHWARQGIGRAREGHMNRHWSRPCEGMPTLPWRRRRPHLFGRESLIAHSHLGLLGSTSHWSTWSPKTYPCHLHFYKTLHGLKDA